MPALVVVLLRHYVLKMTNKVVEKLVSKDELIEVFRSVGVCSGMIIELHIAMSKLGYVIGGAQTVVDALLEILGYNGTLIMAMQCAENSEPSLFINPPLHFEDFQKYRNSFPAYHPKESETYHMGRVVENLRRRDKAIISSHPNVAFVAIGKYAKLLCNHQDLDFALGESSPLGRLYELKASALLVGVDYDNMTSLHLAEYKTEARPIVLNGAAINENGHRVWKKFCELDMDSDDFIKIGSSLEKQNLVYKTKFNQAEIKLVRIDYAVDEGIKYFNERYKYYR